MLTDSYRARLRALAAAAPERPTPAEEFYAEARIAVPALLDEIDALRDALAKISDIRTLIEQYNAAIARAEACEAERDAISIQLQGVQADMGTIAGVLDADNDDVGTLVDLIQSRLADRSEALAALRSIARYISCEPEDHDDLVEAVRLLVQERDEARAERDRLHATLKAVADVCIDKGKLRVSECVAEDAPPRAAAKLVEQRDAAIAESAYRIENETRATKERDAAIARAEAAERDTAEAIAKFAIEKSYCKDQHGAEYRNGDLINFAADIRAGAWRKS